MASKLARQLQELKICNNYGLLTRFGKKQDVVCEYVLRVPHACTCNRTQVWSPRFKTDTKAPWYDYGMKTFLGNRAESMPEALAWASQEYSITEWAPSPFGGKIPKTVLDRAKAAVKAAAKEGS